MIVFICSRHGETCPPFCDELLDAAEVKIPHWAICPISLEVMNHPVTDQFGHSYEQEFLQRHFDVFDRSPLTNILYTSNRWCVTNYALKHAITEWWNAAVKKVRQVWRNNETNGVTPNNRQPPIYQMPNPRAPPNSPETPTPLPRINTRLTRHRRNLPWIRTDVSTVHHNGDTSTEEDELSAQD